MAKWSSDKLKGIIEISTAAAVLLGLVFVGMELRNNTAAVEAQTLQNLTDESTQFLNLIASDTNLLTVWMRAGEDIEQLSEEERWRLHFLVRSQWFRFHNSYLQWTKGTLEDEHWQIYWEFICPRDKGQISQGTRIRVTTWQEHRNVFGSEFQELVDECYDTLDVAHIN